MLSAGDFGVTLLYGVNCFFDVTKMLCDAFALQNHCGPSRARS
jgi:hypothetical protein